MGAEDGQSPLSRNRLPAAGGISDRRRPIFARPSPAPCGAARSTCSLHFRPGDGLELARGRRRSARLADRSAPSRWRRRRAPRRASTSWTCCAGRAWCATPRERCRAADRGRARPARGGARPSSTRFRDSEGGRLARGARAALRRARWISPRRSPSGLPEVRARMRAQAARAHRAARAATSTTSGSNRSSPCSRSDWTSTRRSIGCAAT